MSAKKFQRLRRLRRTVFGAIVLLIVLTISLPLWLFVYHYERIPKQVYQETPSSDLRNPLLALERYLNGTGVRVVHTTLSEFQRQKLSVREPILLLDGGRGVRDEKYDSLVAWVNEGGHLIMAATLDPLAKTDAEVEFAAHPLLSTLGVELMMQVRPEPIEPGFDSLGAESLFEFIEQMTGSDLTLVVKQASATSTVNLESKRSVWRINIPDTTSLQVNQEVDIQFSGANQSGLQFIQLAYGKGHVSLFKTFDPLLDHALLDEDHLHFILALLDVPSPRTTQVTWLVPSPSPPWLWLVIQYAPLPLLLLLLAGGLWAWRSSVRFGPPLEEYELSARSRQMEHIEASGWLIWHHQAEKELVDRLRSSLKHRIKKRYSDALRLTDVTGLPPEVFARALYDEQAKKSRRKWFVDTLKAIQQVSRRL